MILINRVKPHTDFHGRYESGLMKMALIGLGKREGALAVHQFGVSGLRELIGPGHAGCSREARFSPALALLKTRTTAR